MSIQAKFNHIQHNILKYFKKKEAKQVETESENHVKVTVIMSAPTDERKGKHSPCEKIRRLSRKLTIRKSSQEKENQKRENETDVNGVENMKNNDLSSHMKIHLPQDGMFFAELPLIKFLTAQQKDVVINVKGLKLEIYVPRDVDKTSCTENHEMEIYKEAATGCKKKKEAVAEEGVQKERGITDDDLMLYGHIILPMYIDTETLEFSIDEDQSFHIQANIKGAINMSPRALGLRGNDPENEPRRGSLVEWLACRSPLLRSQISKRRFSGPVAMQQNISAGRFQFSPSNSPLTSPLFRHLSSDHETSSLSVNSCPNSPFLFPRRLNGSTTSQGVFRPSQSPKAKGLKTKARKNSCRWELELPRPSGGLGNFGPKRLPPRSPLCDSSTDESTPSPFGPMHQNDRFTFPVKN